MHHVRCPLYLKFDAAKFNTSGTTLIESLSLDGNVKAKGGQLLVHLQNGPDEGELVGSRPSVSGLTGKIDSVKVEQKGPVRAVIKVSKSGHTERININIPAMTR